MTDRSIYDQRIAIAEQAKTERKTRAVEQLQKELADYDQKHPGVRTVIAAKFTPGRPNALDHLEHVVAMQRISIPLQLVTYESRSVADEILFVAMARVPKPLEQLAP